MKENVRMTVLKRAVVMKKITKETEEIEETEVEKMILKIGSLISISESSISLEVREN